MQALPARVPAGTGLDARPVAVEAAFILRSEDPDFGGLSGLWLDPAGERLVAISDTGFLWRARLAHDPSGRLAALGPWSVAAIPRRPGDPDDGRAFDAEALADDGRGGLVVAYEGHHRLRRLPLADLESRPAALPLPPGLGGPSNSGIETLTSLDRGRLLAVAERVGAPGGGGLAAWLIDGTAVAELVYLPAPGFAPTGADRLDDRIYVVERQFSLLGGFRTRIVSMGASAVRPGARLHGETVATFRWGDIGENFEAIAARRAPDGRILLYLLSDDNFSFLQSTILVQLALPATPTQ